MNMTSANNCLPSTPTWATSDYFAASFLIARGWRVLGVDGSPPRRRFIIYDPNPSRREALILDYQLGVNDSVSATELFRAQRTLQRLLRDAEG